MPAGSIVIDLLMKTGSFETDTDRAAKKLKGFKKEVLDFKAALTASFAGNLLAGAVEEAVSQLARIPQAFKDLVDGVARFQDIEETIGAAAEEFAGFSLALGQAGTSADSLAEFSVKLTKNLSKIDDEAKGAGAALAALGIPVEDFKRLDPVGQIDALSKALAGFANGPQKTAVLESLVKGGAQFLPFLKALNEQGGRQNILTREQIQLADDYADRQGKAAAQLRIYAEIAATQALPALTALSQEAGNVLKALAGLDGESKSLSSSTAIGDFARDAAVGLAVVLEAAIGTAKAIRAIGGSFQAVGADIGTGADFAKLTLASFLPGDEFERRKAELAKSLEQRNKIVDEANKRYVDLWNYNGTAISDAVRKALSSEQRVIDKLQQDPRELARRGRGAAARRQIDTSGLATATGSGANDDPTKKLLENQLKALEAAAGREQQIAQDRNRFLNLYNDQGLVSIRAYYDAQRVILEAGTSAQVKAYDEQIAALQAYQAKAGKATDRADAEGKIADLREKRAKVEQDAGAKAIELTIKQEEAQRRLDDQVKGLSASVLELQGNLGEAAAIRFDQQNFELVRRLAAAGNVEALKLVETLRKATIAQADYTKAATESQRVIDLLSITEDRVNISRQLGATTELGALKQLGDARQDAVHQLESIVAAEEAIAKASGNPALIQQAQRARIELEKLRATADPLADKFRGIFEDSFGSALGDFITGTKSASDAFKAFADSVFQQISRLFAQNLAQSIFGGADSAGGGLIGSFFSSIFGGARAGGGPVDPSSAYLVGENGPELFRPNTAGQIVPASQTARSMNGRTVNFSPTFVLSGPVDRRTQDQIAAAAGRGVQRAMARNT